jgi:ferredoxin
MDALLDGLHLAPVAGRPFAPPVAGALATFIHSPKRQKYFLAVRNTALFRWLAGTDWFGALLFKTGLRQDVFCREEMRLEKLTLDRAACDGCGVCRDFCPAGLDPASVHAAEGSADAPAGADTACLGCLYCFLACPKTALAFHGEEGFLAEQRRQYDALVRSLAPPACPQEKDLPAR